VEDLPAADARAPYSIVQNEDSAKNRKKNNHQIEKNMETSQEGSGKQETLFFLDDGCQPSR
jgi:hypothetical protein